MKMKCIAAAALIVLGVATLGSAQANRYRYGDSRYDSRYGDRMMVSAIPAGTPIDVRLDNEISTENAHPGDSWTGTVDQPVSASDGRQVVPAGSAVSGVITTAAEGTHDSHAQLGLAVREISVNGDTRRIRADAEPIVAGTQRAKKIGAIAGGAAAGALLGHAVGEHSHGALIGGVLGGAAGYGLTRHAFRTLQLKAGTVVRFTTRRDFVASR